MRTIIFLVGMLSFLVITLPVLVVAIVTKSDSIAMWFIHNFAKWANFLAGNKVIVENKENILIDESFLLVANHEGIFDLANIYATIPNKMGFISKIENNKIPIIRIWMKLIHVLLMDRSDVRQSVGIINQASNNIKNGISMGIMPEGTRNTIDMPFAPGSLKIAIKAKTTIIPVTIRNTASIFEEQKKIKKNNSLIYFHQPIRYEDYQQLSSIELAEHIQAIIHGVNFEDKRAKIS